MSKSRIEWTEETWNPVTGCSKVSPGCENCYAEREALGRLKGKNGYPGLPWTKVNAPTNVVLHPDRLEIPLRAKRPRMYFVNSMSDLFHEEVPDEFIDRVFAVMALTPHHTYQVLTKRAKRMREYMEGRDWGNAANATHDEYIKHLEREMYLAGEVLPPLPNVWLGVSAEDQKRADERIPLLLQTPAAVKFVSVEPLLELIDLSRYMWPVHSSWPAKYSSAEEARADGAEVKRNRQCLVLAHDVFLDQVIVGGESGPRARPMHPDWARSIRDQCVEAGAPFFFKQWGEWAPGPKQWPDRARVTLDDGQDMCRVGKKAAGRKLDGLVWDEMPEQKAGRTAVAAGAERR